MSEPAPARTMRHERGSNAGQAQPAFREAGGAATARQVRASMLGPPGAGKGTQAERLAHHFGLPHVDTGALLRAEMAAGTPFSRLLEQYLPKGLLAPDDLVTQVVLRRLAEPDARAGFVLDGFPRSLPQALWLDAALSAQRRPLTAVVLLRVSESTLWRRLLNRVVCGACGAIYNEQTKPPRPGEICTRCRTPLIRVGDHVECEGCHEPITRRPDDQPGAIEERILAYRRETVPVLEHYRALGLLREVDGEGPEDVVFRRVLDALG